MAMNHVGPTQLGEHRPLKRVEALSAHIPWIPQHANSQRPYRLAPLAFAEAQQRGGDDFGHVARELERIALRAPWRTIAVEQRRDHVKDARSRATVGRIQREALRVQRCQHRWDYLTTLSSKLRNQA